MEKIAEKPLVYTIGCPKCRELEELFQERKIEYDICNDVKLMIERGLNMSRWLKSGIKFIISKRLKNGPKIFNYEVERWKVVNKS